MNELLREEETNSSALSVWSNTFWTWLADDEVEPPEPALLQTGRRQLPLLSPGSLLTLQESPCGLKPFSN